MIFMLRAFHKCMIFYGSIGYIMAGSFFKSLLHRIYAKHTAVNILSGKTFARATRVHVITDLLSALLIRNIFNIGFDLNVDDESLPRNSMKL